MTAPAEFDRSKVFPVEVVVNGTSREDVEYAMRMFKTLFNRERIIGQLKEKRAYEKPSDRKRRKKRESAQRILMTERRERMMKTGEWDKVQKKKAQSRIKKEEKESEV